MNSTTLQSSLDFSQQIVRGVTRSDPVPAAPAHHSRPRGNGIPEGQFDFREIVFQGIANLDRKIHVKLHAKGTSERIIDIAQSTMPVSLTPKYPPSTWVFRTSLPPSGRQRKAPRGSDQNGALFELCNGTRRFMRYSYGDLFQKDRTYDVTGAATRRGPAAAKKYRTNLG